MSTWALVPARSFATAKSRLGELGSGRGAVAQALLAHVLDTLAGSVDGVLVATDGDDVARFAAARGAEVLFDLGRPSLADVIDRGLAALADRGAARAIVLMADLPLVQACDVRKLLCALGDADLVAAPDRDHLGTNALGLHLPAALPTCFGNADSYRRHVVAASARAMRIVTIDRDGLGFDLDGPADLADLLATRPSEPDARIGDQGAVGAETRLGVVDTIERIAGVAGLEVQHAQHAVERGTLRRDATRAAGDAP
jgi:2-phospho-L-lactate guanylyltransferase